MKAIAIKATRLVAALWLLALWYPFVRYLVRLDEVYGGEWFFFGLRAGEMLLLVTFAILPILTVLQIGRRPDKYDPPDDSYRLRNDR